MGRSRRFLLLPLAMILVFLLLRDGGPDPESVSTPHSSSQIQTPRDEDGVRRPSPYGAGEKRPQELPKVGTAKRAGEWNDAPTRLEVLVIDEETRAPLPEATVHVADLWSWSRKFSGETGPDGRTTLELDRGHYWLFALHPDYLSHHVSLAAEGLEARRTIPLLSRGPETLVTGSVRDRTGQGVPEVSVSLRAEPESREGMRLRHKKPADVPVRVWNRIQRRAEQPRWAKTDRNGFFSLEAPKGRYALNVFTLRYRPYMDVVQIPPPGPLEIVLTEPDEMVRLSGWISGEEGGPLAAAKVNLDLRMESGRTGFDHATTDSEGYFEFDLPPGLATVRAQLDGYQKFREVYEVIRDTEIFPVLKAYRSFTVRVYDSNGRTVADPFVIGTALESGKGIVSPVAGEAGGSKQTQIYHATEYPFRIYATALHLGRGITEAKVIRSYQANIDLRVKGGGRIEGNVADSDGNPVRDFTIVLRKDGFDLGIFRSFSQEGRFSLEGIPPGLYSLSFHSRPELDWTQESRRTQSELATVRPKLVSIQKDRTSFLDVVLRPQGWVKTAGQRSEPPDSHPETRLEY